MKQHISILIIVLMVSLVACSNQAIPPASTSNAGNIQSNNVTMLDEGVWPVNVYTEGLPVPPGTVAWAALDEEYKNCSAHITGIRESDYTGYMENLKQEGFSTITDVSEEVEGADYVSSGMLLSNGEKWLSISYIPDSLTIYISFDNK